MTRELRTYLLISFGWTWLLGALFCIGGVDLASAAGVVLLAVLYYVPSPLVAAVIAERGLRRPVGAYDHAFCRGRLR